MDATLTEEEELLAETASRVATDLSPASGAGAGLDGERAWAVLAASGLLGMRAEAEAEERASVVNAALCAEAFGRVASPAPLVGPMLAVELLRVAGADPGELSRLASGELRVTVALDHGLGDLAYAGAPGSVAFDALGATGAIVLDGTSELAAPALVGLADADRDAIDLTRRIVDVAGPARSLGGRVAQDELDRWLAFGLVVVCADMVGTMTGALAMAVDYAGQRRQFGRPIGSFQAIQHLCAEQHVSVEAARSATYYAAWAVDALDADAALLAARVAKAYIGRVSRPVGEAVLQVYGGIGQTWECAAHYFLRRLLCDRAVLGDEHRHEEILAALLLANGSSTGQGDGARGG